MNNATILECHQVSKYYQEATATITVLNDLNIAVKQGESVAIVGVSGAGKTTLLQLLGGLDHPSSGTVKVMNQDLRLLNEREKSYFRNRHIGFIYQFHHLLPEFNALENVMMPLLIRGVAYQVAAKKADDLIGQVGLKHRRVHRVNELSGGERQRVAIARALVTEPNCVLADEPTGNLDQATADHVFELMIQLNRVRQVSLIMVTHNRELAKQHDRMLLLHQGQLQEVGDSHD